MHACCVSYQLAHILSDGKTAYIKAFDKKEKGFFIPGELVFFRPSPTILSCTLPKTANRLIAGIFLDYYTPRAGQLSGQYIVCPLSDFEGKSLHQAVNKSEFRLRLNRTEVVRRKANSVLPIFPL